MMRFVLKYPDSLQGGLILFGVAMFIGIVGLYVLMKANQAQICKQGIQHEQSQYDSDARVCRAAGGNWTGNCCMRPKRSVPGVKKCSR